MDLDEVRRNWELMGSQNPMWAILTARTNWDREGFFATGRQQVDQIVEHLKAIPAHVEPGRALDFGCGMGRLTQALCEYFKDCDGVDIAEAMITQARAANQFGDRCRYHQNSQNDLRIFPSETFDFVLSLIVLQHMQPKYSSRYILEFLRVLRIGGVAYFQIPSVPFAGPSPVVAEDEIPITVSPVRSPEPDVAASPPKSSVEGGEKGSVGETGGRMEMAGIPRPVLLELLRRSGGEVLACARDDMAGPAFESYTYCVRKAAVPGRL